jgi:ribosomal protein L28
MENFNEDKNIIKMKITNEILKKIENTVNYQNYFANKYSNDNNYQTFLNNLSL